MDGQQHQHRQAGESHEGQPSQAHQGLGQKDTARRQRADQQELQGLAPRQLGQAPTHQQGPLDDSGNQEDMADHRARLRRPLTGQDPDEAEKHGQVSDQGAPEGELTDRRQSSLCEKRGYHGAYFKSTTE